MVAFGGKRGSFPTITLVDLSQVFISLFFFSNVFLTNLANTNRKNKVIMCLMERLIKCPSLNGEVNNNHFVLLNYFIY